MSEEIKDFDSLLKGMMDGTLSEEEQYELEEILKTDSEARKRYLDYMAVESMLASHRVKIESADLPDKKTLRFSSGKTEAIKRKASKKRKSSPILMMAACMFLAFGLGYYLKFYQGSSVPEVIKESRLIATVEQISGQASITVNGQKVNLTEGQEIKENTDLNLSNNAEVQLRFIDDSIIRLSPKSKLNLAWNEGQYSLSLTKGYLSAEVNKQEANKPLIIKTPEAGITVLGTTLRVGVSTNSTMLTVDEGKVEIKNKNNEKLIVNSDEVAVAETDKPLKARNIKEYKVDSLEILSAVYGAENKWVDVTAHLRSIAGNSRLIPTGRFVLFAGDPLHLVVKEMKIEYKINGKKESSVFNEYSNVEKRIVRTEVILPK